VSNLISVGPILAAECRYLLNNSPYPSYLERGVIGLGLYDNLPPLRGNGPTLALIATTLIFTM
jgi:hypothetical protein